MPGSEGQTTEIQSLARSLRMMFAAMFVACALYIVVLVELADQIEPHPLGVWLNALRALAVFLAGGVLYVRFVLIARILGTDDLRPRIPKLRVYYVLSYVLCEAIALGGFALRFAGGSFNAALPFFGAAVLLFALCYPKFDWT